MKVVDSSASLAYFTEEPSADSRWRLRPNGWFLIFNPFAIVPLIFYFGIFIIWNTRGFAP